MDRIVYDIQADSTIIEHGVKTEGRHKSCKHITVKAVNRSSAREAGTNGREELSSGTSEEGSPLNINETTGDAIMGLMGGQSTTTTAQSAENTVNNTTTSNKSPDRGNGEAAYAASTSLSGNRVEEATNSKDGEEQDNSSTNTMGNLQLDRLKCFMVNARSVVKKGDELQCCVVEENPDIIMITESWANDKICDAELSLSGYTILRNDRSAGRGGGCLIYCRDTLPVSLEEDLMATPNTESVWCKLKTKEGDTVFGVCYLSPSSIELQIESLNSLLRKATERYNSIFICGDFNHRTIDWDLLQAEQEGKQFLDLVQNCFLVQHVDKPTRGNNILDLVLSSNENMVENLTVKEPFGTSDHNVVLFHAITKTELQQWRSVYYDYRKGNYEGMKGYLSDTNWDDVLGKPTVDETWVSFKGVIEEAIDKFVPKRECSVKTRKPMWWSRRIEKIRKKKFHLWKRYTETQQYED